MKGAVNCIQAAIGNTPIVALNRLGAGLRHRLYGKCEFMNPGGSVKDRIGFYMVEQAERDGRLRPGGTIVEATAGNTGMALAMAAAQRGYRFIAVMTTKMSIEKVRMMRACGAEVRVVPYGLPPDDPNAFTNYAKLLAAQIPNAWYVDQFNNVDNYWVHFKGTGPEIWNQCEGEIDVLVAGIGTGGTLCGAGAYLKTRKSSIRLVMADPEGSILRSAADGADPAEARPYLVEGIGGDFLPGIANLASIDYSYTIPDSESVRTAVRLFRTEGIFAGASSGCILAAAIRFCRDYPGEALNVLAILPDGGRSYLSTIYDPEWCVQHGLDCGREVGACT